MHPPRALSLIAAVALAGCARGGPPVEAATDVVAPHRFSVDLTARFETTVEGPPGPAGPWADARDLTERWTLDLETSPGRRYRDDSLGERVRFVGVTVDAGDGPRPHPLQGHGVTLRRFESGEILAVEGAPHVVGGGRQLEVLDLLLPLLSPKVPALREGESVTANTRWPLPLGPGLELKGLLRLAWTLDDIERSGPESTWALSYTGHWLTRLQEGEGDRRTWETTEATGEAAGALWLSRTDGAVQRHEFSWSRVVALPAATGADTRIVQRQSFDGAVVRR